jgi:membrane-bound lytic murein transglycosylase D
LHALAKRFKVPTKVLAAWNNMKEAVALMPGKRLIVAKSTKSAHKTG